jgi:hypothetical protein
MKHQQWRQSDGSVHITGAWIHVADIREAYQKNYVGTLRVCKPQFKLGLKAISETGWRKPEHTLKDALEHVYAERTGAQFVEPIYHGRELIDI